MVKFNINSMPIFHLLQEHIVNLSISYSIHLSRYLSTTPDPLPQTPPTRYPPNKQVPDRDRIALDVADDLNGKENAEKEEEDEEYNSLEGSTSDGT